MCSHSTHVPAPGKVAGLGLLRQRLLARACYLRGLFEGFLLLPGCSAGLGVPLQLDSPESSSQHSSLLTLESCQFQRVPEGILGCSLSVSRSFPEGWNVSV